MTMTEKQGYDALQHRICVGLGFCGCIKNDKPLHVDDFIPFDGFVSASQFAEWVFLADNMNPKLDRWQKLKKDIEDAFVEHIGGEVVEAKKLKWSHTIKS